MHNYVGSWMSISHINYYY